MGGNRKMTPFPENKVVVISMNIQTRYKVFDKTVKLYEEDAAKELDELIIFLQKVRKDEFYEEGKWKG